MAIKQKRRQLVAPAAPIKRPSVKVEKYRGYAKLSGQAAKLIENWNTEKESKRKHVPREHIVFNHLKNEFDKRPDNYRTKQGAFAHFINNSTYDEYAQSVQETMGEYASENLVDEDTFNKAIRNILDYRDLNVKDREIEKMALRIAKTGTEWHPTKDLKMSFKQSLNEAAGRNIYDTLAPEAINKLGYTFTQSSIERQIIKQKAKAAQSAGSMPNFAPVYAAVHQKVKANELTPKQGRSLLQQIDNVQASGINMYNLIQNQRDKKAKNAAAMEILGKLNKSPVSPTTQVGIGNYKYNNRVDTLISYADQGVISWTDASSAFNALPFAGEEQVMIKARQKFDQFRVKARGNVLPQRQKFTVTGLVPNPKAGVITSTDDTLFGVDFLSQAYFNQMNHPDERRRKLYKSANSVSRQNISARSMGLPSGDAAIYSNTQQFAIMAQAMDSIGVRGSDFADAVFLGDKKKGDAIIQRILSYGNPGIGSGMSQALNMLGYVPKAPKAPVEKKDSFIQRMMKILGNVGTEGGMNDARENQGRQETAEAQ